MDCLKNCIEACGNSCIAAYFEDHPGGKRKIVREALVLRLKSCRFKRLKWDCTNQYILCGDLMEKIAKVNGLHRPVSTMWTCV